MMSMQVCKLTTARVMGRTNGARRIPVRKRVAGTVWAAFLATGVAFSAQSAAADTPKPHTYTDESWITISGTVDTVKADEFSLDYGDGMVVVEMDDGDRDADAYKLLRGDKVIVSGRIDDDMFETTTIEAASVYVENLGTTFFSSAVDEEHREILYSVNVPPVVVARTSVRGVVTEVNDDEFMIDNGSRQLRVDVSEMDYNPLDDEGYQKITVGDRVHVIGQFDVNLFEGRRLEAETVVTLYSS